MASIKKQIKHEFERYKSLVIEFEENENNSNLSLESTNMKMFLNKLLSFETKEDLDELKERNDFFELLMPERFNNDISNYLFKELSVPFPTKDYKQSFIDIANKSEDNIKEINLLRLKNSFENYLEKVHESLIVILVKEATVNDQNPRELLIALMKKYSKLYNKDSYEWAMENISKTDFFKKYENLDLFERVNIKAKESAFCWSYNQERILISFNYENGRLVETFSESKIKEMLQVFIDS